MSEALADAANESQKRPVPVLYRRRGVRAEKRPCRLQYAMKLMMKRLVPDQPVK